MTRPVPQSPFPEPTMPLASRSAVLLGYLDYSRSRMLAKLAELPEDELRRSRLPSAWTPVQLINHLTQVELRWLEWGFLGLPFDDPWADQRDGRWYVAAEQGLQQLIENANRQAARTREIVLSHDLDEVGQPGPRWDGAEPATLERILLHLVQEYARHLGHLDIVAELAGGTVGE
jgi:uncharacterized damage-inducible protein DinB